ncbi:hypothetical protein V9T40_010519 [Parthenolecanium corni]|uniref:Uncharacterized protein n=1 Tax=Parthenolecanium corni TaxID=536013 RepID=A0AAN9XYI5_9HEMI
MKMKKRKKKKEEERKSSGRRGGSTAADEIIGRDATRRDAVTKAAAAAAAASVVLAIRRLRAESPNQQEGAEIGEKSTRLRPADRRDKSVEKSEIVASTRFRRRLALADDATDFGCGASQTLSEQTGSTNDIIFEARRRDTTYLRVRNTNESSEQHQYASIAVEAWRRDATRRDGQELRRAYTPSSSRELRQL